MENEILKLIDQAVSLKTQGDFDASLQYYLKAIDKDQTYNEIYPGLGQVGYLMDRTGFAIISYLSYMHLEINELEKQIVDGLMPAPYQEMYDELPQALKDILPKKSGLLIFYDDDIIRHMSHAVLDHDAKRPKELDGLVAIYREQIQDREPVDYNDLYKKHQITPDQMKKIEQVTYMPRGLKVMVDLIEWDEILNDDVIKIYFSQDSNIRKKK